MFTLKKIDNILSEFSDVGHVINHDICNKDSGSKQKLKGHSSRQGTTRIFPIIDNLHPQFKQQVRNIQPQQCMEERATFRYIQ